MKTVVFSTIASRRRLILANLPFVACRVNLQDFERNVLAPRIVAPNSIELMALAKRRCTISVPVQGQRVDLMPGGAATLNFNTMRTSPDEASP